MAIDADSAGRFNLRHRKYPEIATIRAVRTTAARIWYGDSGIPPPHLLTDAVVVLAVSVAVVLSVVVVGSVWVEVEGTVTVAVV